MHAGPNHYKGMVLKAMACEASWFEHVRVTIHIDSFRNNCPLVRWKKLIRINITESDCKIEFEIILACVNKIELKLLRIYQLYILLVSDQYLGSWINSWV